MPHVLDAVVLRLNVEEAVHARPRQRHGRRQDEQDGRAPHHQGGHPLLEDVLAGPGAGPAGRRPAGPSSLLSLLPLLVQQETRHEEGGGEEEEEYHPQATEVAKSSEYWHALMQNKRN